MAPSFDCGGVGSLLCVEENDSILFDDYNEFDGLTTWDFINHGNYRINNVKDISFNDFGLLSEDCLSLMVEKETQHLPNVDYLKRLRNGEIDLCARKEALDWISKVHSHFGFGPLCAYLSINYLDRFLSAYELPKGKAWTMQLLAVACLSIAAKMEETEVPLSLDLQVGESRFVFEARTIQRMELLVLSTLNWRMQAITPFSFIDNFLYKINNDEQPTKSLILQSIQLISSIIKGIDLLEFRPSEIAAAVAIAVVGEINSVNSEHAISLLAQHVQKERVMKCVKLIKDMGLKCGDSSVNIISIPQSPIGVLDAACLSYRSDESTVESCANSSQNTPDPKRRKLNRQWED